MMLFVHMPAGCIVTSMKQLNRIPKITNKIVLIELARAHFMITSLSVACALLTYLAYAYKALSLPLAVLVIGLLAVCSLFSLLVAWASYQKATKLKK